MQVLIETHHTTQDTKSTQLRDLAESRLRFVMRRMAWLVPRAKVQLSDINGPRGGLDKRCQIELKTDAHGTVVITAVDRDWRAALDNALARASRALVRTWQRTQTQERHPHPRKHARVHMRALSADS